MKRIKNAALQCALLVCAYGTTAGVASAEGLMPGFKPDEWEFANQSETKTQRVIEFVPPGQKIDSWTELVTLQTLKMPRKPPTIDAMAASTYENLVKQCPGKVTWNVIARETAATPGAESILYEWSLKDCPPEADQHEVARVLYGKHNIFRVAYVAKTASLAPEKRAKWIAELTATKIL